MKKQFYFIIVLAFASIAAHGGPLKVGAQFDLGKLGTEKKAVDSTIVAFVPSLTYDCEYASMLTQSFYYYFDRGMAFDLEKNKPAVKVFIVVKDARNEARSTQNIIGGMSVIYDEKGELFSHFEVNTPVGRNGDSTVVLLDTKGNVALIDDGYRAQGEHLKPLENKLKALKGITVKPEEAASKPLKVGDTAVNFRILGHQWLTSFRGEVVLLSFYPAAFSGTFPKPAELKEAVATAPTVSGAKAGEFIPEIKRAMAGVNSESEIRPLTDRGKADFDRSIISCAIQIRGLDLDELAPKKTVKRIVLSSSTPSLLEQWQQALGTENIIYANDPDYSISKQYSSYNPAGYNNRVSVIIDQKGKIAYIDDSFEAGDEAVIEARIAELLKKK